MELENHVGSSARLNAQPLSALHVAGAHLKIQTVVHVTGLSAATIRRKVASGDFPQPIRQGTRCTRWIADEVSAWLRAMGEQGRANAGGHHGD